MRYTVVVIEGIAGKTFWYNEGSLLLHREEGPAIEWANGNKHWYLEGRLHREGGPAVEWHDGTKKWYLEGKCHREDGPAVEYPGGQKYWYLEGKYYTEKEFNEKMKESTPSTSIFPTCEGKVVEIDGKKYKLTLA